LTSKGDTEEHGISDLDALLSGGLVGAIPGTTKDDGVDAADKKGADASDGEDDDVTSDLVECSIIKCSFLGSTFVTI